MKEIGGFWWPDDVGDKWRHSLRHIDSINWAIARCKQQRLAVQAGGNIGLWPCRLSADFARVITFEPEPVSRACLEKNCADLLNVEIHAAALGDGIGSCSVKRRSLGSHQIEPGSGVPVLPLDSLELTEVDLLQLDVEGYEMHALRGACATIVRCSPLIQVELRGFTSKYGASDDQVHGFLSGLDYAVVSRQPGADVVYERR